MDLRALLIILAAMSGTTPEPGADGYRPAPLPAAPVQAPAPHDGGAGLKLYGPPGGPARDEGVRRPG